jgi:hypothetical protein
LEILLRDFSKNIFSPEEIQYLTSLDTIVVEDPNLIHAYANELNRANYIKAEEGPKKISTYANVICYNKNKQMLSIRDFHTVLIYVNVKYFFIFNKRRMSPLDLTPRLSYFFLRSDCANTIEHLGLLLNRNHVDYTKPSDWCENVLKKVQNLGAFLQGLTTINDYFMCSSVRKNYPDTSIQNKSLDSNSPEQSDTSFVCQYAMNPNCKPDSPGNMVLLFETKAGWNQNGGPELFTFDNHDPKGGCVLLNDGTIKFIRTKKELNQLRWK